MIRFQSRKRPDQDDHGWHWYSNDGFHVCGYAFNKERELLKDQQLINHFSNAKDEHELIHLTSELNGFFAIVSEQNGGFAATDRLRSFPLFFKEENGDVLISDHIDLQDISDQDQIDAVSAEELLSAGYVTGTSSILERWKQIPSCHLFIPNSKRGQFLSYYNHISNSLTSSSPSTLLNEIEGITRNAFSDVIKIAGGKQLVVPISGGYDSRLVLVALKDLGYENIICYTYGIKDSYEVSMARQICDKLKVDWHFVEYNDKKWSDFFQSHQFEEYFSYAGNLTSNPHFQDFPAIHELVRAGHIHSDAFVVPGHSADLLAGKWIPVEVNEYNEKALLKKPLSELILKIHYGLQQEIVSPELKNRVKSSLPKNEFDDIQQYIQHYDQWNINERQAKFTVNSLRVFDFMGLKWLMPLWDNHFTEFWHRIPLPMKIDKEFYEKFVMERFFEPAEVGFRRHQNTTERPMMLKLKKLLPYFIANPLREMIQRLRALKKGNHFNAFDKIYSILHQELTANEKVVIKKTMNLNQIVAQYYLYLIRKRF